MPISTQLQRTRGADCFIKKETTSGTFIKPTASDAFRLAEAMKFQQVPNLSQFAETSKDVVSQATTRNKFDYGTGRLAIYAKASGTAGTAWVEDLLLENFWGKKTINASTDVTYTPLSDIVTFSTAEGLGFDSVEYGVGVVISDFSVAFDQDGAMMYDFNALATKVLHGGTVLVNGSHPLGSETTISTKDANTSLMFFDQAEIGAYNPSTGAIIGTAQTVSGAQSGTDLVIDTTFGAALADNDWIRHVLPTPSFGTGSILSKADAAVYIGAQDDAVGTLFGAGNKVTVKSLSLTVSKNLEPQGRTSLTGDEYPATEFIIGNDGFTFEANMAINWRPVEQRRYGQYLKNDKISFGIEVGDTAGKKWRFIARSASVSHGADTEDNSARVVNLAIVNDNDASTLTADSDRLALVCL